MVLRLGNEALFESDLQLIDGRRVGLLTNPSGVDSQLRHTIDRLYEIERLRLTALFGPEHGLRADAEDGVAVIESIDDATGLPAFSLYGNSRKPDGRMLDHIDVMLCDIQDVGVRFYTFLSTLFLSMKSCADHGVPVIVLDRPNPIGGEVIEGNMLDRAFNSFVGVAPLPVRHGMTLGELAFYLNESEGVNCDLEVVKMAGWRRCDDWRATGLTWIPPSPNMPTFETATMYPGTCFFEGTNVSEGRGTLRPFEQIGAPFIDSSLLANELERQELAGVDATPVSFVPSVGKHAGRACGGVFLSVVDPGCFRAVATGLQVLITVARLWPHEFSWHIPAKGIHNFDKLAGTDSLRLAIDAGADLSSILERWEMERSGFVDSRRSHLLY